MSQAIREVSISGLYGQHNLKATLNPQLNIIHGKNGSGKTTFLHILANLVDGDIERFCHIEFDIITITTDSEFIVSLKQSIASERASVTVTINGEAAGKVTRDEITPPALRLLLRERFGGRPTYLPAFRAVLEATAIARASMPGDLHEREVRKIIEHETALDHKRKPETYSSRHVYDALAKKTLQCRDWFGAFVPIIRFPSLQEVTEQLDREVHTAQLGLAATDRKALSTVFVEVLKAVTKETSIDHEADLRSLLGRVKQYLAELQPTVSGNPHDIGVYAEMASLIDQHTERFESNDLSITPILSVYEKVLQNRAKAQEIAYRRLRQFVMSVNKFFEGKKLEIDMSPEPDDRTAPFHLRRKTFINIGDKRRRLSVMSSGERHILTLLFSATHMSSGDGMVLIDEPELSLNVEWQRDILSELIRQSGSRQIVACTHAPEIAADHRSALLEITASDHMPSSSRSTPDSGHHPEHSSDHILIKDVDED